MRMIARSNHSTRSSGTVLLALVSLGCGFSPLDRCDPDQLGANGPTTCPVPGWDDRPFDIFVPAGVAGPAPLLFAFHGGGGNDEGAISITCPDGDRKNASCLDRLALERGYVFVTPNGTGTRPARNSRTWNAGGGNDGFYCSAGPACASGIDDMSYFDDLLAEVERLVGVDRRRVFATGLSNGSSISHRLACQRSSVFAAIAPFSGPNQHAESGGTCEGGVAVLHIHGTEDPCAHWEATDATSCAGISLDGLKVGVDETMEGWRLRNGCQPDATEEALPDVDTQDGSTATRVRWQGCSADVELIRIDGGGHTWPGGNAYLSADKIGRLNRDFLASTVILDFFDVHPTP